MMIMVVPLLAAPLVYVVQSSEEKKERERREREKGVREKIVRGTTLGSDVPVPQSPANLQGEEIRWREAAPAIEGAS